MLLILSLLLPGLQLPDALVPDCPTQISTRSLHRQPGTRLFWGTIVPTAILLLAAGLRVATVPRLGEAADPFPAGGDPKVLTTALSRGWDDITSSCSGRC